MFPKEIIEIIEKYQVNDNYSSQINSNIQSIISVLRDVDTKIKQELISAMSSSVSEEEQSLFNDSQVIRNYIESIQLLPQSKNTNTEIAEEIVPIFEKKVFPFLVTDDICPFCNVKLVSHTIYYQRVIDTQLKDEIVEWHRCPNCKRMFALDYEIDDFDFENTNIFLNKDKYEYIPNIDIYSVIVLSNTLKCSVAHRTKDFVAKLPVLNEHGEISYLKINASYCFDCQRFTILKDDFNSIKDVIMCKIIDETTEYTSQNNDELEITQKQSVLFQYGYNVQTKKNLSEQQRHIILSSIIEANIMSRRDVINHINTLIDRGSKIPSWKTATQKWKDDRQFVSEYQRDSLPEVIFNNIILKYKRIK